MLLVHHLVPDMTVIHTVFFDGLTAVSVYLPLLLGLHLFCSRTYLILLRQVLGRDQGGLHRHPPVDHDAGRGETGAEGAVRDHAAGPGGVRGRGLDGAADAVSSAGSAAERTCGHACGVADNSCRVFVFPSS